METKAERMSKQRLPERSGPEALVQLGGIVQLGQLSSLLSKYLP